MITGSMTDLRFYLTYLGTTTLLTNSPDGWDEQLMTWERSTKYHGLFRSFSIPLKWVRDGAKILRTAFYTYGIEAVVTVRIDKRNKTANNNLYETKYTGVIDFGTFNDTKDFVECSITDSGTSALFKNHADTEQTIVMAGTTMLKYTPPTSNWETPRAQPSILHFLAFCGTGSYLDGPNDREVYYPVYEHGGPDGYTWNWNYELKIGENNWKNLNDNAVIIHNYNDEQTSYVCWLTATKAVKIDLRIFMGNLHVHCRQGTINPDATASYKIQVIKKDLAGTPTVLGQTTDQLFVTHANEWRSKIADGDTLEILDISLVQSDTISFNLNCQTYPHEQFDFCVDIEPDNFTVECAIYSRMAQFDMPCITALELFQRLISDMSGGTITGKSTFLTGKDILITSGEGVRQFIYAEIKTTINDFYDFVFSLYPVGIGIETIAGVDYIVLEELSHFYDNNTLSLTLGNTNNFTAITATDILMSRIDIGPTEGEYDDIFGRDEFNQKEQWALPFTKVTRTADWLTKYHTDNFSLMWTLKNAIVERMNGFETPAKKDTKGDNLIFVIDSYFWYISYLGISYYLPNTFIYEITGVTYPFETLNIALTPKRCLMNHGGLLKGLLYPNTTGKITFQTGLRNFKITTDKLAGGDLVDEDADITISDLVGDIPFYPVYFTVDAPAPFSNTEINLYGYVTFTYLSETYYGFIMEISAKFAGQSTATIKMLAARVNDLTKLIR